MGIGLSGALWRLCSRGKRSIRFCRIVDGGGLLLVAIVGSFLTRFLLVSFVREHSVVTMEGSFMADAYVVMIDLFPAAMFLAIRAALIPSSPRRTIIVTAMVGIPKIVLSSAPGSRRRWEDSPCARPIRASFRGCRRRRSWSGPSRPSRAPSSRGSSTAFGPRSARRAGSDSTCSNRRSVKVRWGSSIARPTPCSVDRRRSSCCSRTERTRPIWRASSARCSYTSRLVHPNTISIFDYGRTAEGVFYYVMEYLDGIDLQRLVDQYGPIEPDRAIHVLAQISGALAEAHALGLIHRDIKPANIVLTERPDEPDVVKVVDFGLVKNFGGSLAESAATDAIIGTPLYMAPEAISQPDTVDGRSDLYAVGAVAYFLLTGTHVFQAASVLEVFSKHMLEAPMSPSQRLGKPLPADLEGLVLRCLAKDRDARPPTATMLRTALLACADAGGYDLATARSWWQAHRTSRKDRPSTTDGDGSRPATMAIDLGGRSTLALNDVG